MSKIYQKGMKTVHRGLHSLQPTYITDAITGEEVSFNSALDDARNLITIMNDEITAHLDNNDWVGKFTRSLISYREDHGKNPNDINARKWAADNDLLIPVNKPRSWKASRLKEMTTRKLITEYGGWLANESQGDDKGDFQLSRTFNPSYTDNQFSTIQCDLENHTVILRMQVMDRKLDFHFKLPVRQIEKLNNVIGVVKPTVRETRTGEIVFDFKLKLEVPLFNKTGYRAGLDLGFIEPYILTIVNNDGKIIARYHATPRCYATLNRLRTAEAELKRLRTIKYRKIQAYKALRIPLAEQENYHGFYCLCREIKRLTVRVSRLKESLAGLIGHEVRNHLEPYNVHSLGVEYLGWLAGGKGHRARNKSWAYGECQSAITDQLELIGVRVRRVPARDTSQECNRCKTRVHHKGRTCYCPIGCLTSNGWDRDLNAAVNIALRL